MHFESRKREHCSLGFIHTGSPDAFLTLAENDSFWSFQRKGLLPPPCAHMHKHSFAYEWGQGHACQVDPKEPSPGSLKTHLSSGKEPLYFLAGIQSSSSSSCGPPSSSGLSSLPLSVSACLSLASDTTHPHCSLSPLSSVGSAGDMNLTLLERNL